MEVGYGIFSGIFLIQVVEWHLLCHFVKKPTSISPGYFTLNFYLRVLLYKGTSKHSKWNSGEILVQNSPDFLTRTFSPNDIINALKQLESKKKRLEKNPLNWEPSPCWVRVYFSTTYFLKFKLWRGIYYVIWLKIFFELFSFLNYVLRLKQSLKITDYMKVTKLTPLPYLRYLIWKHEH